MTKVVNMLLDTSLLLKWSQTAPKAAFAGLGALSEDSNGPNLPRKDYSISKESQIHSR